MTPLDEAIITFQRAYDDLFALIIDYPQEKQTLTDVPVSPKEMLAHLCGWLLEAQRRYPRYEGGTGTIDYNMEGFNAVSVRLRKDKTWAEVVDELKNLSLKMVQMAQALSPRLIEKDNRYAQWLNSLAKDCRECIDQLHEIAN